MKKKIFLILSCLSAFFNANSQCTDGWAKKGGGIESDFGYDVTTDSDGNVYMIGIYQGTALFGAITLNSNAGSIDAFVVKYNATGDVLWAKSFGGSSSNDYGYSIATDVNNDVYIVGSWLSLSNFGSISLSNENVIAAKLSSSGDVQWISKVAESSFMGLDIITKNGNVFFTGNYQGSMTLGTNTVNSQGSYDAFIAKYDSNGIFGDLKSYGGIDQDSGSGLAIDTGGNIILIGRFINTVDFNIGTLISQSSYGDIFTLKLHNDLSEMWVRHGANTLEGSGVKVITDGNNNVFIIGGYSSSATFGSFNLTAAGDKDIFVVKYSSLGTEIWAKSIGSSDRDIASDIKINGDGKLYVCGTYSGLLNAGIVSLNPIGMEDVFVIEMDASGNSMIGFSAGGVNTDYCSALAIDQNNSIYVTGSFVGSSTFGSTNLNAGTWQNAFLWKICDDFSGINEELNNNKISIYPNPSSENFTIDFSSTDLQNHSIQIVNSIGKIVQSIETINSSKVVIDSKKFDRGIYFVEIMDGQNLAKSEKVIVL